MIIPKSYEDKLDYKETEIYIKYVKDNFEANLAENLNLLRVSAPLFVKNNSGLNDNLNGVERPVSFDAKGIDENLEVVHSLAKWTRMALKRYDFKDMGIYTDMNAIRADEDLDNLHSLYVDQWDWCMAIDPADRNIEYLKEVVRKIFRCLKQTEFFVYDRYECIKPILPENITFVYAEDLQKEFPDMTPKQRETEVCKKYGAVFIIGIGGKMADGTIHDGRAPDYDDWITKTADGHTGLNGDLMVWNPVLDSAMELSSMGIRVSPESLKAQLEERGGPERAKLEFHSKLLKGELTQTLGGGIGQSRLCMYFLRKAHIGLLTYL